MNPIPLNIQVGDKVLITCDNWFYAPDGQTYRAVFGTLKSIRTAEDTLGVRPNGKSTNWYVEVGNMLIAGCQIHYALKTDQCHFGPAATSGNHEGKVTESVAPCAIYNADKE